VLTQRRAVLIDDDPFTRTVLASTIESLGHAVLAAVGTAPEGIGAAVAYRADVAVVDLDLGEGPTGIDVVRALRRRLPDIGLVILSTYAHPRLIGHNQSPLPVGTQYVVKSAVATASVLGDAIERAMDRRSDGASAPGPSDSRHMGDVSDLAGLTDLQVDLLRQCAVGYSNAEIARRRCITEGSVEKSIHRLMRDLGMRPSKDQNPRVLLAQAYLRATGSTSPRNG
jgi:DNA-binding NarL/FixJ family response regulator